MSDNSTIEVLQLIQVEADESKSHEVGEGDLTQKETPNKEKTVEEILALKNKISTLITNIRDTKRLCERYKHENQYLQDYVGSLMASGEMQK